MMSNIIRHRLQNMRFMLTEPQTFSATLNCIYICYKLYACSKAADTYTELTTIIYFTFFLFLLYFS